MTSVVGDGRAAVVAQEGFEDQSLKHGCLNKFVTATPGISTT